MPEQDFSSAPIPENGPIPGSLHGDGHQPPIDPFHEAQRSRLEELEHQATSVRDELNKPGVEKVNLARPAVSRDPKQALLDRIEKDFSYHAPQPGQVEKYELIRNTAKKLARVLVENCPVSRELSLALTGLENTVFNANAAIARNS